MKLLANKYTDSQKLIEELNNTAFKYVDVKDINEEHLDHAADAYRYALDRKYGIYAGIDRGENPDETAVRLEIPKPLLDLDIEKNIDRVLSRSELIEQMNELVLKDEQERYVRVLMNRLNTIIKYTEKFVNDSETGGIHPGLIIAIAKGDLHTIYNYEKYLDEETFNIIKGYESKGDE